MGGEGEREGWVLRRGEGEIDDGTGGMVRGGVKGGRWGGGSGGQEGC